MRTQRPRIVIKIALAVFALFCCVTVFKLKMELDGLRSEYTQLRSEIESSEAYVRRLENKLASDFDDKYVESVAKDKLNLVLPEEVIFYNDLAG